MSHQACCKVRRRKVAYISTSNMLYSYKLQKREIYNLKNAKTSEQKLFSGGGWLLPSKPNEEEELFAGFEPTAKRTKRTLVQNARPLGPHDT